MFENFATSIWSAAMALNIAVSGSTGVSTPPVQDVIPAEITTTQGETQTLTVPEGAANPEIQRDEYTVTMPEPEPVIITPPASPQNSSSAPIPNITPDPGSAQEEALRQVTARGWGQDQFNCLVSLWNKESGWNVTAHNKSSGAYGIPQSLPGNKMATAGADWQTNAATQITWGLGYIASRHGTPCGAWGHSQLKNWY